jgi:cytochrome P450
MEAFWGPDAQTFRPERWLDEKDMAEGAMREIKSYKHILSFSDGPRTCLGKGFALTEMKVCSRLTFPFPSVPWFLLFPLLTTLTLAAFYLHH